MYEPRYEQGISIEQFFQKQFFFTISSHYYGHHKIEHLYDNYNNSFRIVFFIYRKNLEKTSLPRLIISDCRVVATMFFPEVL